MWCNQIFSLIKPTIIQVEDKEVIKNIIQNIIVCDNYEVANKIAVATYGEDSFALDTTLFAVSIGNEYLNGIFYDNDGSLILQNPTEEQRVSSLEVVTNQIAQKVNPTINIETCSLEELKTWQINVSKKNLEDYFINNPISSSCHGGVTKQYTITKEKQSLLAQMIIVAQLAINNNIPYTPSWNAQGEPCTYDWTLLELQTLAFEIENIVRPKISHQQMVEAQINACITKDDVLAIDITF